MIDFKTTKEKAPVGLLLAFAAVYFIWGSTYLAIRYAVETIPPFLMMGSRFLVAGVILYAIQRARGLPSPTFKNWKAAVLIGGLMFLGGGGAVAWSEQWLPSGLAALLVAAVPMWIVLVDWLRPGGVRPGRRVLLGLAIGFAGVAVLVGPIDLSGSNRMYLIASIAIIIGSLSWAIGTVFSRRVNLSPAPAMASSQKLLMGGALLMVAGTLAGEWGRFDAGAITLRAGLAWGYLIVFGSLIAFASYVWLLHETTPTRLGSYAYVNPVVAVLVGWAFAGEPVGPRTLFAAAIIIPAVALIVSFRPQKEVEESDIPSGVVTALHRERRPPRLEIVPIDFGSRHVEVDLTRLSRRAEQEEGAHVPSEPEPPSTTKLC
jgi:drug/metabolite transporter (DMT)-like permease